MMRMILTLTLLILTVGMIASGCNDDQDGSGATGDAKVVATTTQVADIARNVAGERAEVAGLLAPNSDPHDHEPRPSDAEAAAGASLILTSGGDLDVWADELVESSGTDADVVALLDSVETIEADQERAHEEGEHEEDETEEEHPGEEVDPHWWQNPANAVLAVEEIRDRLSEIDPDGAAEYEANAAAYIEEIEAIDAGIGRCLGQVPADERKLVTSHDALGYFSDRYEIEPVGAAIPALTTQAQPSAGETAELVELIKVESVNAVFPEAGLNADLEQAIADEAGASVGGELYADTLGEEGTPGETYLGALAANARALAEGFSGGAVTCEDLPS